VSPCAISGSEEVSPDNQLSFAGQDFRHDTPLRQQLIRDGLHDAAVPADRSSCGTGNHPAKTVITGPIHLLHIVRIHLGACWHCPEENDGVVLGGFNLAPFPFKVEGDVGLDRSITRAKFSGFDQNSNTRSTGAWIVIVF
jgi:hypothetical protein